MTDRPILFQPDMVRGLLRELKKTGTGKTRTRRILSRSNTTFDGGPWCNYVAPEAFNLNGAYIDESYPDSPILKMPWDNLGHEVVARLRPRIEVGDLLWVREAWRPKEGYGSWDLIVNYPADGAVVHLEDDIDVGDWRFPKSAAKGNVPSIHMPRWASRLTLKVIGVKIQRLQDITDKEALEEGITEQNVIVDVVCTGGQPNEITEDRYFCDGGDEEGYESAYEAFEALICRINGPDVWTENPWVLEYEFKVEAKNVDGVRS